MQRAILLKVKDGQYETWKNWCRELSTSLLNEAERTLQEEQVLQELVLGFEIDGAHYIVGFMEGECLPANMDREVNNRHKEMKQQCLEYAGEADVLYNIKKDSK